MTQAHTEQPALLPCPFCVDHAETDFIPEHHSYAIECHSIGCAARVIKETAAEVVAAWNRRTQSASQARVPLSDEDICEALGIDGSDDWTYTVARAIEAAHGITQEQGDA